MIQHTGDTFSILTNHSSMKLSSILQMEESIITTTGTLTRVKLSSKKINLTIETSELRN